MNHRNMDREKDRDLLLRKLTGALSAPEAAALDERLAGDTELARTWTELRGIGQEIRGARPSGFEPGFAGRVMDRIAAEGVPVLAFEAALRRQVLRLLPLAAAAVLLLLAHNVVLVEGTAGQSPLEAALGLEPVTLDIAYSFDPTLYDVSTVAFEGSGP